MKKLITLSTILLLTGILLTSCKSGFTFSKRHYTKGYYFAGNHHPHRLESKDASGKTIAADKVAEVKVLAEQTPIITYTTPLVVLDNNILVANNEKRQDTPSKKNNSAPFTTHKIKSIDDHISHIDLTQLNTKKIGNASRESDGLSLFWIIILIILIFWALGFLADGFGLGALIHVLLIIALILLILWLLRIV